MVTVLNIDRFPRFVAIQPTLLLIKPRMLYIGWCKRYFYCISINPLSRSAGSHLIPVMWIFPDIFPDIYGRSRHTYFVVIDGLLRSLPIKGSQTRRAVSEMEVVTMSCVLGGSVSNLYAFLAARHKLFPGYKEHGLHSIKGQLVMFTSEQVSTFSWRIRTPSLLSDTNSRQHRVQWMFNIKSNACSAQIAHRSVSGGVELFLLR